MARATSTAKPILHCPMKVSPLSPWRDPPKPSLGMDALGWEDLLLGAEAAGVPWGPADMLKAGDVLGSSCPSSWGRGIISRTDTPTTPKGSIIWDQAPKQPDGPGRLLPMAKGSTGCISWRGGRARSDLLPLRKRVGEARGEQCYACSSALAAAAAGLRAQEMEPK